LLVNSLDVQAPRI